MFDKCGSITSPAIIYDYNSLCHVINTLKKDIRIIKKAKLYVSMKANRNPLLNKYMARLLDGVDVSSYEEFKIAKAAGYHNISATSPGIRIEHINEMILQNVKFDFDNLEQLSTYSNLYNGEQKTNDIGIRLRIPVHSGYSTTFLSQSRFGIDLSHTENRTTLKGLQKKYNYRIRSIHIHIGELNNVDTVKKVLDFLLEIIPILKDLKSLNFGGGFTRLYSDQHEAKKTFELINSFIEDNLPNLEEVIFEPGMLVYVMAGYLKTSVLSVNNNVVNMDSSYWNLVEWTEENLNLIYNSSELGSKSQKIVGNTCYEDDIFFDDIECNKLQINDYILLFPFGAYTISMSKSLHGNPLPKEYIYDGDKFIDLADKGGINNL